ncbi:molybdopterin-guanine dinucleotide biosynthesis protein B [bacterium]|nr:molybdopterin-guanine dinucleotide biosynthesis protein B [bacterium]
MQSVLSIVGKSNSGKTTLIEKLVPELKRRGYRIGTIKHDAHDFEIDYPGKDSHRHYQAGAEQVLIASPHKLALVKQLSDTVPLDTLIERYCHELDLVITEGYKSADKPKIEVFRPDIHQEPLDLKSDELIAFVSDTALRHDVPCFQPHQIVELADLIEQTFL